MKDARLTKALDRLAERKHAGHLELRLAVAYYEPLPKGVKKLRTGRYFVTKFVGGPLESRDLGGDDAGLLPLRDVQALLAEKPEK